MRVPHCMDGVGVCACMCLCGQLPEVLQVEFSMGWHDEITYSKKVKKNNGPRE